MPIVATGLITITDSNDAVLYYINQSADAISKDSPDINTDGAHTPSSLTFTPYKTIGNSTPIIATDAYYTQWTSGTTEASTASPITAALTVNIASNADISSITYRIYKDANKTTLLAEKIVPVVFKGTAGTNGTNSITINYTNDSLTVPQTAAGVSTWTGSGGQLQIFDGSTALTLSSNTQGTTTPTTNGQYVLDITKVSGDTLTEPAITGAAGTTATIADWAGTLTTATVYRITAYIKTLAGTSVTVSTDVSISPSKAGANGNDATAYWLVTSAPAVQKNIAGVYTPASVTYNIKSATGTGSPADYAGRFIIATSTDGSTYSAQYTSAANESNYTYSVPANIKTIRVRAYLAGGTTTLIDELITTIVSDGATGAAGTNSVTINYTNDSLTVPQTAAGVSTWTGSGGQLQIFEGTTLLTYRSTGNAQSTVTPATNGEYVLDITKISGDTLTEPNISGTGTTTVTLGEWGGTLTTATVYRITAYIKTLAGTSVTVSTDVSISPSKAGANGNDATAYWLVTSAPAVQKDAGGTYTPASVNYTIKSATGTAAPANYAGRFIIATSTDGSTYSAQYTSAANESSYTYTVPTNIKTIRVRAYLAGGTTTLVDELITTIVSDGADSTVPGPTGTSIVELSVYARASSAPTATPSGGTFNFSNKQLTSAPTGAGATWTSAVPSGTNPLYISRGVASSTDPAATAVIPTWTAPVLLVQNGTRGSVVGSGVSYGIVSNSWSDGLANRVVDNVVKNLNNTTSLASTTGNNIGDTVTLSNAGYWIETRGVYSASTQYAVGDIVLTSSVSGASAYRARAANLNKPIGNPDFWALVRSNLNASTSWASSTYYTTQSVVTFTVATGQSVTWLASVTHTSGSDFLYDAYRGDSPWLLAKGTLYSSTVSYGPGDIVIQGGVAYIAIQPSFGQDPTTTYWRIFRQSVGTSSTWSASTVYAANSVVTAPDAAGNTRTWLCLYQHTSPSTFAASRDILGFSETRYWSGISWVTPGQIIDGNLLVKGTISGDKIAAGSISADRISSTSVVADGVFGLGGEDKLNGRRAVGRFSIIGSDNDRFALFATSGYQEDTLGQPFATLHTSPRAYAAGFYNSAGVQNSEQNTFSTVVALAKGIVSAGGDGEAFLCKALMQAGSRTGANTFTLGTMGNIGLGNNAVSSQVILGRSEYAGDFVYNGTSYPAPATPLSRLRICENSNAIQVLNGNSILKTTEINGNLSVTTVGGTVSNITATGNITAYASDDRLKIKHGNIQNALNKVNSLNGFHFTMNDTAKALGFSQTPEVGVSAQEVQKVLPEIVVPAPVSSMYLTVRYEKLVPLLIEAIKELTEKIKVLEDKLK